MSIAAYVERRRRVAGKRGWKSSGGGDQPVAVGAPHVNEIKGLMPGIIQLVEESSAVVHESGADRAVVTGEQNAHQELDALEAGILAELAPVHMPVTHRFTPGLYTREIFMPAGTVLTSKIHNTEHPFVVLSGRARVVVPGGEVVELAAGHVGITQPGTRRALYIEEDCRWATFHPLSAEEEEARQGGASDEEMLEAIEERIILKRDRLDGRNVHREYLEGLEMVKQLGGAS